MYHKTLFWYQAAISINPALSWGIVHDTNALILTHDDGTQTIISKIEELASALEVTVDEVIEAILAIVLSDMT